MPPRVAPRRAESADLRSLGEYFAQPRIAPPKSGAAEPAIEIIFNPLNTCFLRLNINYIIVDANPIAVDWLNSTRHDIIGRHFASVFHGLDADILRDAIEGDAFANCHLQSSLRPDRWVDMHIHPDGQGAIVFFKDITERRRKGQIAHNTSELLQASLNTLPAHVVILDKTGGIVASNLAWQRFASANKLTGSQAGRSLNYLSLYDDMFEHCPQARTIREALASVLAGGRPAMRQVYAWNATKSVRWFEIRASRLNCERESHFVVVNEEVTAVKEAEQALGEAAESLMTLQEEERERIAEELHDSTAQHLVAAGLNLMSLRSRIDARGEALEFLDRIEDSLGEASKELRTLTYLLHPPSLEAQGLEETVHRYVEGFGKRTGVKARLNIGPGVDALPFVLQRPIFRVIQEALANVHRHASASRVSIELRCMIDHLHLVVRDNGRGIGGAKRPWQRLNEPPSLGVGIPGIRARLRQFGGQLVIKSGLRGTMLHAIVPTVEAAAHEYPGHWPAAGNLSRPFGVSADVKNKALQ